MSSHWKNLKAPKGSSIIGNVAKAVAGKYILDKMGGKGGAGGTAPKKSAEDWENEDIAKERDLDRRSRERKDVLTDIDERPHIASYEDKPGGGVKVSTRARPAAKAPAKRAPAKKPAAGAAKSKQLENVTPKDNTKTASTGTVTAKPAAKPKKGYTPGPKF
jgi:hypothetical protein